MLQLPSEIVMFYLFFKTAPPHPTRLLLLYLKHKMDLCVCINAKMVQIDGKGEKWQRS